MTKTTIITEGQSLLDVTVQELGGVAAIFDLADAAGLGITDALAAGQELTVPASAAANAAVVGYYQRRGYRVNTHGLSVPDTTPPATGIDFDLNDFTPTDFL